jgi:cobalt/nickel transport system permease protein
MEAGLRVLPEVLPSSRIFLAATVLGLGSIVSVSALVAGGVLA